MRTVLIALLLCTPLALNAKERRWPTMKPQWFLFHFIQGRSETFSVDLESTSGTPVYRMDCSSAQSSSQLQLPSRDDTWTGDFECHLLSLREEPVNYQSLLLSRDDPTVSTGRAVFTAYELKGDCSRYPDYGFVREFRLRGMKITLSLKNVVFQSYAEENHFNGVRKADLLIRVDSDPGSRSALALPSKYRKPRVINPKESDFNRYRMDCRVIPKTVEK